MEQPCALVQHICILCVIVIPHQIPYSAERYLRQNLCVGLLQITCRKASCLCVMKFNNKSEAIMPHP